MEWVEQLNQAVKHIEAHITEDVNVEHLARIAYCSSYHFQRMFTCLAGMTLSEYIRRRRLSLAAADLQSSDAKVIDIALKYGYNSPTAFNRAFQSIHGLSPSEARKPGVSVKSYPPLTFKIIVKGAEEMNYRIEQKPAFRIVGITKGLSRTLEENFAEVPRLWQQAAMDGTVPRLASMMNSQPMGIMGVCACNDAEDWRYYIAVATDAPAETPLEEYTVPAFTWAIFPGEGPCPQAIQELEQRVMTEWLPTSGYEYANGPDVELYLNPDPSNGKFEVWLPVKKKA